MVRFAPSSPKRSAFRLARRTAISKDACVLRQPKEKSLESATAFRARRSTAAVLGRSHAGRRAPEPGVETVFADSEAPIRSLIFAALAFSSSAKSSMTDRATNRKPNDTNTIPNIKAISVTGFCPLGASNSLSSASSKFGLSTLNLSRAPFVELSHRPCMSALWHTALAVNAGATKQISRFFEGLLLRR